MIRFPQIDEIFNIQSESDFNRMALEIYHFQRQNCPVYREWCDLLHQPAPDNWREIPCLPISFFKTHRVLVENTTVELTFKSSGTTQQTRSQHLVAEASVYQHSLQKAYELFIGNPEKQIIAALLPNYLEQGESSLVYMVHELIQQTHNRYSGFYLHEPDAITKLWKVAHSEGKELVIFGVTYALLDLAEKGVELPGARIIETGGMKGRREEISKSRLHKLLKQSFKVKSIISEYGMTELLSQGYALQDGQFYFPPWMRVRLREVNDPFQSLSKVKTGGIQVIDLANVYSCSFIDTQDLGRWHNDALNLAGRYDHSDLRGCNLLVQ